MFHFSRWKHQTLASARSATLSVLALSVLALSAIGTVCSALRREAKSAETANLRLPRSAPQRARRINLLAWRIFPLTRVTRIFQKNVFTKTALAGSGGPPLGIFVMGAAWLPRKTMKRCAEAAAGGQA